MNIVEVRGLGCHSGKVQALQDVDFAVEPGRVYGLVGANGAGKTTLLRHLLGLIRPEQGSVRVFGLDPVRHPVEVLQKVGYLSEHRDQPAGTKTHRGSDGLGQGHRPSAQDEVPRR